MNLIEKDLDRLSPSHSIVAPISILYSSSPTVVGGSKERDTGNDPKTSSTDIKPTTINSVEERKKQRIQLLSQILFIYARHNPSLGYRQGMVSKRDIDHRPMISHAMIAHDN